MWQEKRDEQDREDTPLPSRGEPVWLVSGFSLVGMEGPGYVVKAHTKVFPGSVLFSHELENQISGSWSGIKIDQNDLLPCAQG
ncbi:MAG: hypothetical protein NPIRA06_01460 [Nitrospirales bacterium]|nr:MAG: hypothetical protein NPIRA06_01460 [Nitrospirales bacterium]